jgi:hypothetical protein
MWGRVDPFQWRDTPEVVMPTFFLNARIVVPQGIDALPMGTVERLDLFNLWVIRNHRIESHCDARDVEKSVYVRLSDVVGHPLCPADGRWSLSGSPLMRDAMHEAVVGGNSYD